MLVLFRDGEACVQCQDSLSGLQPAENQDEDGCSGAHQRSGETGPNQTEVRTCVTHTHTHTEKCPIYIAATLLWCV